MVLLGDRVQKFVVYLRKAANGMSRARLKAILAKPCRCHRLDCFVRVGKAEETVVAFLKAFWSLQKPAQDAYVVSSVCLPHFHRSQFLHMAVKTSMVLVQSDAEIHNVLAHLPKGNRHWTFVQEIISQKCLASVLGIRSGRFDFAQSGRFDRRFACFGSAPNPALCCQVVVGMKSMERCG